ncbi:MAG: glycosyltransferase family 39 protein [Phycisphaeraceae bacterium]
MTSTHPSAERQASPSPPTPPTAAARPSASARLLGWCDRHRRALFAGVFLVYLAGFNAQWRIISDSALSLTIARNIADGRGFTHPLGEHLRVNPGFPYLLAGLMEITGTTDPDGLWLAVSLVTGVALSSLALAYWLFHLHLDRPQAVLLTVMLGLSMPFYRYSFDLRADMFFLFGVMVFLVAWERFAQRHDADRPHWPAAAPDALLLGAGVVIMVLLRTPAITVLAAAVLALAWHAVRRPTRRTLVIGAAGVALCAAALAVALYSSGGGADADTLARSPAPTDFELIARRLTNLGAIFSNVPENAHRMFTDSVAEATIGIRPGPVPAVPITLFALAAGLALAWRRPLWGLLVFGFVAQMLLFLTAHRYFLPLLPLLLLGWWLAALWLERRLPRRWGTGALAFLIILWTVPNGIRSADFMLEQRARPFIEHFQDGRYVSLAQFVRALDEAIEPGGVVLTDNRHVHTMIYFGGDLPIVTPRAYEAGLVRGQPAVDAPLYAIAPMGRTLRRLLREEGWTLGAPVVEIERLDEDRPWRVLRIESRAADGPADR